MRAKDVTKHIESCESAGRTAWFAAKVSGRMVPVLYHGGAREHDVRKMREFKNWATQRNLTLSAGRLRHPLPGLEHRVWATADPIKRGRVVGYEPGITIVLIRIRWTDETESAVTADMVEEVDA